MKRKFILIHLLLGFLILTGCSGNLDGYAVNTMIIEKNGTISDVSVEDFSDGTYDMQELEAYINTEIDEYNETHGEDKIILQQLETENSLVKLQLDYASMEDYNSFNHTDYELSSFADTVVNGEFTSTADGSSIRSSDIDAAGMMVLKVQDAMNIVCKGKVLYYNTNVKEQDGVFSATGDNTAIIVFK